MRTRSPDTSAPDTSAPVTPTPHTPTPHTPAPHTPAPHTPAGPADSGSGPLRFGISSAATAVEARPPADGPSIWHAFAAAPGRITDATVPMDGPDLLTHWRTDLGLLRGLGVDSYRFSLPWSALPDRSAPAWDHYARMVDDLLAADIEPIVTLTHYDMPLDVMERGGWLIPATADEFGDYAGWAAARLADRVPTFLTMNSPLVHTSYGYGLGIEAPGLTLLGGSLDAGRHQLLGHGTAVAQLRGAGARRVGIANAHAPVTPDDPDSPADVAAAQLFDTLHNRAFLEPLLGLPWPVELSTFPGAPVEPFTPDQRALIAAPLDLYGVNYYHPHRVQAAPDNASIPFALMDPRPGQRTDEFGWPVEPAALTALLLDLTERYPALPQLWVTEHGIQDSGRHDDQIRAAGIAEHLAAVAAARSLGADVGGYLYWTLTDSWEFGEGLSRKFGLVAVDRPDRTRHPKASYRSLAAARDAAGPAR